MPLWWNADDYYKYATKRSFTANSLPLYCPELMLSGVYNGTSGNFTDTQTKGFGCKGASWVCWTCNIQWMYLKRTYCQLCETFMHLFIFYLSALLVSSYYLGEKGPYSELFWSVSSHIQTEYGEMFRIYLFNYSFIHSFIYSFI